MYDKMKSSEHRSSRKEHSTKGEQKRNSLYFKKTPSSMGGADSGCMPDGRRTEDKSGEQVKSWKRDGMR
jgi:hypothetical protein